jgi:polysaccharide biosynthesis/export protein
LTFLQSTKSIKNIIYPISILFNSIFFKVMMRYLLKLIPLLTLSGLLTACSIVPRDGPTQSEIRSNAQTSTGDSHERLPYALVNLAPSILNAANQATTAATPSFGQLPRQNSASQNVRISVGDVITVTIFEAASGGLFIPSEAGSRSGNFVQVPSQQVDSSGFIDVPYAGSVKVGGSTARAASAVIAKRLASRAIEPQVVLSLNERKGNNVNVLGEVNQPARFALDPGGVRLTGAIARAGGSKHPAYETIITIQRGSNTYRSMLSSIIRNPSQNVEIYSGDTVYLSREPKYALIFGATSDGNNGNTRKINFDNDVMTMAEGLAKANGLVSTRADPRALFVFRTETKKYLNSIGVDTSSYATNQVHTVYAVDLSTADGMFLINQFNLRDKDVIVASDSATVDYLKFINIVNQTLLTPSSASVSVINATK